MAHFKGAIDGSARPGSARSRFISRSIRFLALSVLSMTRSLIRGWVLRSLKRAQCGAYYYHQVDDLPIFWSKIWAR